MVPYNPQLQGITVHETWRPDVLRLDLLHPEISGNKWFKLKRNLEDVRRLGKTGLLTFGGAFSNHIAATAAAGRLAGIPTIGIIRGEMHHNSTLDTARANGMQLQPMNRKDYAEKDGGRVQQQLRDRYGDVLIVPEGGNNPAGWMGSAEILSPQWHYDYIFCACGTAATYTGLLMSAPAGSHVIGISVLRGENSLPAQVMSNLRSLAVPHDQPIAGDEALSGELLSGHAILSTYAFGGYACRDEALLRFKRDFEDSVAIPLDHIYTVKLFYALTDLFRKGKLPSGARVLAVHSGGLQGNAGFETRYGISKDGVTRPGSHGN